LIVTRAGASTIAEITAVGVPAVMIPSPHVTHNHQEKNANVLGNNGSAVVIKEKELTSDILLSTIDSLINDDKKLKSMKEASKKLGVRDSATKIACIIENLVSGDKKCKK
jgi:UDP-N-acetylglucosamine--N-acetylmuramyl-(pentapeptide) pyrophosphoryl-undecaprenol N-acetylglucosamine transferase